MEWSCGTITGHSRVFSLEKNESFVAEIRVIDIGNLDINNPINIGTESYTSYAKLTDKGIGFTAGVP
ncbi:MAG TPA: hypothetical protein VF853_10795 [Candidatus Deferrimicrobiaceae bacterium]